ncbi:hypothetical protein MYXO_03195 [Myxococcaceae bacterium]|nr:hypothetical protein MYXO_03195 [Myxococcaceae bacterium]
MSGSKDIVVIGPALATDALLASAAAGSRAALERDGDALRFDFALAGHGAWAIVRRELAFELPEHYRLRLRLRGEGAPVELQVKLVDPSGRNVWWWRERGFVPPAVATDLVLRRASLRFAWGPLSGGEPRQVAAVEVAVASDTDAAGSLRIEELGIEPRAVHPRPPEALECRASSELRAGSAARLARGGRGRWSPAASDRSPRLELDLGDAREIGGLIVERAAAEPPVPLRVIGVDETGSERLLFDDPAAPSPAWLGTAEAEARLLRIEFPAGWRGEVTRVRVVPIELAISPARHAAAIARRLPRGRLPRHLLGEHAYWAVVGGDGDARKAILTEDAALEVDAESFTLEPFLRVDGELVTWSDVESSQRLEAGPLPIPSVVWRSGDLELETTAFASGDSAERILVARYTLTNRRPTPRDVRLVVAIRPFQAMPEWQSLNLTPAIAPIRSLAREGATVRVNDARSVASISAPDAIVAGSPEADPGDFLRDDAAPLDRCEDPLGFAEAAFVFDRRLGPEGRASVTLALTVSPAGETPRAGLAEADALAFERDAFDDAVTRWSARVARVGIVFPEAAGEIAETFRASLGWILVNREGPKIQPGPRCYRRSWIRDGALTASALAELGFAEEAKAFFRWYAPFQLPDGRVPCAIDRHGIDHAVEHDSHGELVFGVVETFRLTGDVSFLHELWPHVRRAADAIAALVELRKGASFAGDPRRGLLPESISHEGYASQPVHSYWDDFFALRGFDDAAHAAAIVGDASARGRYEALRDELRRDLHASIHETMSRHGLDVLPGSVELGDFDPTSTAIAFDPCGEDERLPRAALERTFERYWQELDERRSGARPFDAYTAYEIRNAVALVRLGHKERALALLEALIADQRTRPWREWPEVTTRDPRAPRFLGDLPHGWIASGFLRSVRRLLVDERRGPGVLVIGAGVPESWLDEGVSVHGLPTIFGRLDLEIRRIGASEVRLRFGGECRPPGGVAIGPLASGQVRALRVDGTTQRVAGAAEPRLAELPAELVVVYEASGPSSIRTS